MESYSLGEVSDVVRVTSYCCSSMLAHHNYSVTEVHLVLFDWAPC